jgi:predicted glycoside hydrolase/deacetylase ChbG (UPF0249 family)
MRLILNGDDLGVSESVNECIFALMEQEKVTSATLLMNCPFTEATAAQLARYRQCSFGVHLNTTAFFPLTAHPGLKPLLNNQGEFAGNIRRIKLTSTIRQGVFAEWSAQIERAIALGVPISHLDSHHHTHTSPALFGVLKAVQRQFGIRKIRLTRNVFARSESKSNALLVSKALWNFMLRSCYSTRTTSGLTSFGSFYERLHTGPKLPDEIEVMCHPGGTGFEAENQLLGGSWKEDLPRGTQLISYNHL